MTESIEPSLRKSKPCAVVIFGASGDLTRRKLLPALWNLHVEGRLSEGFSVLGMARSPMTDEEFRKQAWEGITKHSRFRDPDPAKWKEFEAGIFYHRGEYNSPESYTELKAHLEQIKKDRSSGGNHLYYLATPPKGYEEIGQQLGAAGMASEKDGWSRIIVEKPFGTDLESARNLNAVLKGVFQERQIYRIDHYLGKETVQNLMVLRFGNGMFEPIWNQRYVDHVQISAAERLGVEGRGGYYEDAGALRDMVQNHLMQVMCLIAMEPPARLNDRAVRNEKQKVLESVRRIPLEELPRWTARGQYGAGEMEGKEVPGYLQEPGVSPHSQTETFSAVKFMIDNWRWGGVPFYLRSGKRMASRVTQVSIHFRSAPHLLFRDFGQEPPERNVLTLRIQPNEGIGLRFGVKVPGAGMTIRPVKMDFDYDEEFHAESPEAYERLLLDCMLGDITLFSRDDWMETSWELLDPVLRAWKAQGGPLPQYPAGSWGPAEADALLAQDGRSWWTPE